MPGTDAVNVDQLNAAMGALGGNSMAYTDQQVGKLRKQGSKGAPQPMVGKTRWAWPWPIKSVKA